MLLIYDSHAGSKSVTQLNDNSQTVMQTGSLKSNYSRVINGFNAAIRLGRFIDQSLNL